MLKKIIHALAERPTIFNFLRRVLEFNYIGEKSVVRSEVGEYRQVLDLGCGTGELCREFAAEKYAGIDISEIYIEYAKKKNPGYRFEVMDAVSLKFSDNCFDVVLVSGVLHHCDNKIFRAILGEIKRVLANQGTVLVWEDVPTRNKINVVGKIIQRLDEGDNILSPMNYQELFTEYFKIEKTYPMSSGFCDYQVFVLKK